MARSAADLTLMLDLLAEPDDATLGIVYRLALPAARHETLAEYRVLVVDTHPLIPTSSSVRTAINELADGIVLSGAKVARQSSLMPDQAESARLYMRLLMSLLSASFPAEVYLALGAAATKLDAADLSLPAERTRRRDEPSRLAYGR